MAAFGAQARNSYPAQNTPRIGSGGPAQGYDSGDPYMGAGGFSRRNRYNMGMGSGQ
ncbi:hypothetical protein [Hymenobacter segetis]|uniref:hypothetical protein n=1 Tax=Hymenobacter segetis TaxID=2025509 RepID=UPI00313B930C